MRATCTCFFNLGHCMVEAIFFSLYKLSRITLRIKKRVKIKINSIGSCSKLMSTSNSSWHHRKRFQNKTATPSTWTATKHRSTTPVTALATSTATISRPQKHKKIVLSSSFLRFQDLRAKKLFVNMLMKLTPDDVRKKYALKLATRPSFNSN